MSDNKREIVGVEAKLQALNDATESAIRYVHRKRNSINGAVNWADLSCCSAQHVIELGGRSWFRVEIEEVSPDASEFQFAIAERLTTLGWPDVEVATEW